MTGTFQCATFQKATFQTNCAPAPTTGGGPAGHHRRQVNAMPILPTRPNDDELAILLLMEET